MFDSTLENSLIRKDISDVLADYVSIQPDIDESKVKAASIVAQKIDIKRLIGQPNIDRCIDPTVQADKDLTVLVVPALAYFTMYRLLKMFPGTFTDGGYMFDAEASDTSVTRSAANQMASIAEAFMEEVIDFLEDETEDDELVVPENLTPRIRSFGGKETRSDNELLSIDGHTTITCEVL